MIYLSILLCVFVVPLMLAGSLLILQGALVLYLFSLSILLRLFGFEKWAGLVNDVMLKVELL